MFSHQVKKKVFLIFTLLALINLCFWVGSVSTEDVSVTQLECSIEAPRVSADGEYTVTHTFDTMMELSGSYYFDQTHTMQCTYDFTEIGSNTSISCLGESAGDGLDSYSTTLRILEQGGTEVYSTTFNYNGEVNVPYLTSDYIFELTLDYTYEYEACTSTGGSVCQSTINNEHETTEKIIVMDNPILAPQITHTIEEGNSFVPYGHSFKHSDPNIAEYGVGFEGNLKAYWKKGEITSESDFSSPSKFTSCNFNNGEWWVPEEAEYVDDLSELPNKFTIGFKYQTPTGDSPYTFVTIEKKSAVNTTILIIAAVGIVGIIGIVVFIKKRKKSSRRPEVDYGAGTNYEAVSSAPVVTEAASWDDEVNWDDDPDWVEEEYECPYCGKGIPENASFCTKCGEEIEWE